MLSFIEDKLYKTLYNDKQSPIEGLPTKLTWTMKLLEFKIGLSMLSSFYSNLFKASNT